MTPIRRRRPTLRAARLGAGPVRQLLTFVGGVIVGGVLVAAALRVAGPPAPEAGLEAAAAAGAGAPRNAPASSAVRPVAAASPAPSARDVSSVRDASSVRDVSSASVAAARGAEPPRAEPMPSAEPAAPDPGAALLAHASRTGPQKGFGLQLGAYETEAEVAQVLAQHASSLDGLELWVLPVELEGKGTWHRLRVGKFATRREAEAMRARLSGELAEVAIVVSHR